MSLAFKASKLPVKIIAIQRLEALEARIAFDASLAVWDTTETASTPAPEPLPPVESAVIEAPVVIEPTQARREIVFIDRAVADPTSLLSALPAQAEVHFVSGTSDGLVEIAAILSGSNQRFDAVHVLSHGDRGMLQLGANMVDFSALQQHETEAFTTIGRALHDHGDLLVYACDFGAATAGETAVRTLAGLTRSDVAASMDATGAAALGGDWSLERVTGDIQSRSIDAPEWNGLMAPLLMSATGAPTVTGASGTNITSGLLEGGVGMVAIWTNAGTVGGSPIDLRATVLSLSAGTVSFTTSGDDPTVALNAPATASIRWEMFAAGTNQTVVAVGSPNLQIADIDGVGGSPNTRETVRPQLNGLTSYTVESVSNLVVSTGASGVTVSGTQNQNGESTSLARFSWQNVSNWTVDYLFAPGSGFGNAFYRHDGDGDFTFVAPTTVRLLSLDLDANNSTATGFDRAATFTEGGAAVPIADIDAAVAQNAALGSTIHAANATLLNAQTGDQLLVASSIGPTGSFTAGGTTFSYTITSGTGTISVALTGAATPAQYALALQQITFQNVSDNPVTTARQIDVTVTNTTFGTTSDPARATIAITPVNDAPVAVVDPVVVSVSGGAVTVPVLANDTDPDGDALTVTTVNGQPITLGVPLVLASGTTVTLGAGGVLTVTPVATAAASETITYGISDGNGGTSSASFEVWKMPIVPPVVDLSGNTTPDTAILYGHQQASPGDRNQPQFTANGTFASVGNEVIGAGLSGSYTGGTRLDVSGAGAATLSGAIAADDYISMSFVTDSAMPPRWLMEAIKLNSGATTYNFALAISTDGFQTATLLGKDFGSPGGAPYYDAPGTSYPFFNTTDYQLQPGQSYEVRAYLYNTSGGAASTIRWDDFYLRAGADPTSHETTFAEGGPRVTIGAPDTNTEDADSAQLQSATIVLTNPQAGDNLATGALPGGITASTYDSATGTITLSGVASKADYATAIRLITFGNPSDTPATVDRLVQVTVTDTTGLVSAPAIATIHVIPVNDAPTVALPAAPTVTEDTAQPLTGISIADVDAGTAPVTVTLAVGNGTLALDPAIPGGLGAGDIAGNGTGSVTLTGTIAQINATLAASTGLGYTGNPGFHGADALAITVNDGGSSGSGGALTANASLPITVTSVNDAPTGADRTITTLEDQPHTFSPADFGFADPGDTPANTLAGVVITTLPGAGTLTLGGVPVTAGQVIPATSLGSLVYTPPANGNGTALADFTFQVQDNGGTGNGGVDLDPTPNRITFNVDPVNDAPAITLDPGNVSGGPDDDGYETVFTEGNPPVLIIDAATADITDVDGNLSSFTIVVGPRPDLNNEVITVLGVPVELDRFTSQFVTLGGEQFHINYNRFNSRLDVSVLNSTTGIDSALFDQILRSVTYENRSENPSGIDRNFTFQATDYAGYVSNIVTSTVHVLPVNDPPVATGEAVILDEDTSASGNLLANETDVDGGPLVVNAYTVAGLPGPLLPGPATVIPGVGALTIAANGAWSFTPEPNYSGPVPDITYTVSDGAGGTDTAVLQLSITPLEDAGAITNTADGIGGPPGTDGLVREADLPTGAVQAGGFTITDPDGITMVTIGGIDLTPAMLAAATPLTPIVIPGETEGLIEITGFDPATGEVRYTYVLTGPVAHPLSGAPVIDSFPIVLTDSFGTRTIGALDIAIADDAHTAQSDTDQISENATLAATGNVVTGIDAPGGDPNGSDGVADRLGADLTTTPVQAVGSGSGTIMVPAGQPVTGLYGTLTLLPNGAYTYLPATAMPAVNSLGTGDSLTDVFTYRIVDADGDVSTATLTITIEGVNDGPVVVDPTQPGPIGNPTPVTDPSRVLLPATVADASALPPINVAEVFRDPEGQPLTFTATGLPPGLTLDPVTGIVSGTVPGDASQGGPSADGRYPVTITATDPEGRSVETMLLITVTNPPPVAADDAAVVTEDMPQAGNLLANDRDPDADALRIVAIAIDGLPRPFTVGTPVVISGVGTVLVNADGNWRFDPAPNYDGPVPALSYTVEDADGGTDEGRLQLTMTPVNDGPVVVDPANPGSLPNPTPATDPSRVLPPTTIQDATALPPINVAEVFRDPEGQPLTFTATGLPPGLTLDPVTGIVSGTVAGDASQGGPTADGRYPVTITATDPQGRSVETTLLIIVTNPPPVAVDDAATADAGRPTVISVLPSDKDPDGDTVRVVAARSDQGTVTINADGQLTFTPSPAFSGEALITYTIVDANGGQSTATVRVMVAAEAAFVAPAVIAVPEMPTERAKAPSSAIGSSGLSVLMAAYGAQKIGDTAERGSDDNGFRRYLDNVTGGERGPFVPFEPRTFLGGTTGLTLADAEGKGALWVETQFGDGQFVLRIHEKGEDGKLRLVQHRLAGETDISWLETLGRDLHAGIPPAGLENQVIEIEATLASGEKIRRRIAIAPRLGQAGIAPLEATGAMAD